MKIVHIADINHFANGITTVVLELSNAQRQIGNEVLILNLHKDSVDMHGILKVKNNYEVIEHLERFQPDIVIFHGVFYPQIKKLASEVYKRGIPYLIEPHGAYSKDNYKKSRIKKFFFKYIYFHPVIRNAEGVIFLNQNEHRNFIINTQKLPVYILPNGCKKNGDLRSRDISESSKITFLFLSRYDVFHKGLDFLTDAIRILESENALNNVEFQFYGTGKLKNLEWLGRLTANLSDHVIINDAVYGKEKETVLKKADIFILTSRYEGFPMSILEALSYGCPCIVSKYTNVGDIISHYNAGWTIDDLNAKSVAEMIKKSIKDYRSNSGKIRSNALKASENFQWDKIALKSIDIYRRVLETK